MSDCVVTWMLFIYARTARSKEEARSMLQGVGSRFDFHINKASCGLRTKEIFDIIIDFPESKGALQDLRACHVLLPFRQVLDLENRNTCSVGLRNELVQAVEADNCKRLLQPTADTRLFLAQYVATIKCLRISIPPPVLLYKAANRFVNTSGNGGFKTSIIDNSLGTFIPFTSRFRTFPNWLDKLLPTPCK